MGAHWEWRRGHVFPFPTFRPHSTRRGSLLSFGLLLFPSSVSRPVRSLHTTPLPLSQSVVIPPPAPASPSSVRGDLPQPRQQIPSRSHVDFTPSIYLCHLRRDVSIPSIIPPHSTSPSLYPLIAPRALAFWVLPVFDLLVTSVHSLSCCCVRRIILGALSPCFPPQRHR